MIRSGIFVAGLFASVFAATEVGAQSRVDYQWSFRALDGSTVQLSQYQGKVLFINAWASWCVPCVREMAAIERLAASLADTDVVFLLIAVESEGPVKRHLRRYPVGLPVFIEQERFPLVFGLRGVPMSWIINRDGRIVFRHYGAAAWDIVAEPYLRELVQGVR